MIIIKSSIKTTFAIILILFLSSCGAATSYDAPLEPGQTVFQKQEANGMNNNQNNIPEPGQNQMKQQNANDLPEPAQTEMKKDDDDDNITERDKQR